MNILSDIYSDASLIMSQISDQRSQPGIADRTIYLDKNDKVQECGSAWGFIPVSVYDPTHSLLSWLSELEGKLDAVHEGVSSYAEKPEHDTKLANRSITYSSCYTRLYRINLNREKLEDVYLNNVLLAKMIAAKSNTDEATAESQAQVVQAFLVDNNIPPAYAEVIINAVIKSIEDDRNAIHFNRNLLVPKLKALLQELAQ